MQTLDCKVSRLHPIIADIVDTDQTHCARDVPRAQASPRLGLLADRVITPTILQDHTIVRHCNNIVIIC